jgi:hypothetical protein
MDGGCEGALWKPGTFMAAYTINIEQAVDGARCRSGGHGAALVHRLEGRFQGSA